MMIIVSILLVVLLLPNFNYISMVKCRKRHKPRQVNINEAYLHTDVATHNLTFVSQM